MICRFVRLKATFVLTLDKSLGTGTYAKRKPPFCGVYPLLMCVENRFCKCAGFEQGEAEDNGVGRKGENRAVQVIRYNHAVYQNRINADAYHNEEALKTEGEQGF